MGARVTRMGFAGGCWRKSELSAMTDATGRADFLVLRVAKEPERPPGARMRRRRGALRRILSSQDHDPVRDILRNLRDERWH